MAKKTDSELLALLSAEESQAVGYYGSEVSEQRRKALQYYHGEPFGNEVEGRSKYVSRDVSEAVEMVMPSLMRIFFAGDNVVKFEPQNQNDEMAAKQATDYVNYIIQRQNNGFLSCYQWFKDALLQKNGFLKIYWEEYGEVKKETYYDLDEIEFQKILMDPDVEPLEHTLKADEKTGQVLHDLKVQVDKTYGKCCIDPIPPEEVIVARGTTIDIRKARFIAHRTKRTLSEWRTMGYDVKDDEGSSEAEFDAERIQRRSFDEDYQFQVEEGKDTATRQVWGLEAYLRIDHDGDGIAELRKILRIGNKIYDNEEVDCIPFVTLTPYIMSHKLFGLSLADHLMDIQELKSTFIRQMLDNMYNLNNGRYMVLEGMVNLQDALNSTPGGVVRVKTFDAMKRLDTPQLPNQAWQVLEFLDMEKENRTGLSKLAPGPDENVLNSTATGANIRFQRVGERIELIARVFAETGFKDLCYAILELVQKHQTKPQVIKLRDQWVEMNPREWTQKFDMSVSVGLGTGSKDQIMRSVGMLWQMQLQALELGLPVVQPENLYNTGTKFAEASEMKGEDLYFTHPQKIPPKQPQPDPAIIKAQMDNQTKLQTAGIKDQTARWKHATNLQVKEKQSGLQMMDKQADREHEMRSKAVDQMHDIRMKPQDMDPRLQLFLDKYEIDKDDELELVDILLTAQNDARRAQAQSTKSKSDT
jgi:hypothetical protein